MLGFHATVRLHSQAKSWAEAILKLQIPEDALKDLEDKKAAALLAAQTRLKDKSLQAWHLQAQMVVPGVKFNYKELLVFSTNNGTKDIIYAMRMIHESKVSHIWFPEYAPDNELSDEQIYNLGSILVGRACQSLGYHVPKDLSTTTIHCALRLLHTIMVDRRRVLVVPPAPQGPTLTRPLLRPFLQPTIVPPPRAWSDDAESDNESGADIEKSFVARITRLEVYQVMAGNCFPDYLNQNFQVYLQGEKEAAVFVKFAPNARKGANYLRTILEGANTAQLPLEFLLKFDYWGAKLSQRRTLILTRGHIREVLRLARLLTVVGQVMGLNDGDEEPTDLTSTVSHK
ncbi:hypothetical protein J3458_001200 [Metarhizium acridum]|uniref:uncharacterized protein n=1 Tax=Metarhizium acridum TaxID=92637 RepID=UPI001C6B353D|nr:hypothetical protein J3458_001200 [Metarhizium acridum]